MKGKGATVRHEGQALHTINPFILAKVRQYEGIYGMKGKGVTG